MYVVTSHKHPPCVLYVCVMQVYIQLVYLYNLQCSQLREEVATLRDKLGYQVEEQSQMESTIVQLKDKLHQSEVSHSSTKGEVCIITLCSLYA